MAHCDHLKESDETFVIDLMEYHRINPLIQLNKEEILAALGPVLDLCPVSSGMSNTGYRVTTSCGQFLMKRYAKATGKAEAGSLSYLQGRIPVPGMLCYEPGASYVIMEWIDGIPLDRYLNEGGALTDDLVRQMAFMTSVIHQKEFLHDATLDHRLQPLTARPSEHEKLLYTLTRKPAAHLDPALIRGLTEFVYDHEQAFRQLEARSVLLHGDLSFDNMLLKDGTLYYIDFEFASAGSPYCDLGHLLRPGEGASSPFSKQLLKVFREAYDRSASAPLSDHWLLLSRLADLNSMLCLLNLDDPPVSWIRIIEETIRTTIGF